MRVFRVNDQVLLLGTSLASSGFQSLGMIMRNAGNTGPLVEPSIAYSGSTTISGDNVTIEDRIITGTLTVTGNNFTMRNCVLNHTGTWGINGNTAGYMTVEYCRLAGPGTGGAANAPILGKGIFRRLDLSGAGNGLVLKDGTSLVQDCYIHDLRSSNAEEHFDGISVQGGQVDTVIEGNTIYSWNTSCIIIKADFDNIDGTIVRRNFLLNDAPDRQNSYTFYSVNGSTYTTTNTTLQDNVIQEGFYGHWSVNASITMSGNTDYDTGNPIP